MEKINTQKSELIYNIIDSGDFYRSTVQKGSRSRMNVTFRIKDESKEDKFVKEAAEKGMIELKGHRYVFSCYISSSKDPWVEYERPYITPCLLKVSRRWHLSWKSLRKNTQNKTVGRKFPSWKKNNSKLMSFLESLPSHSKENFVNISSKKRSKVNIFYWTRETHFREARKETNCIYARPWNSTTQRSR